MTKKIPIMPEEMDRALVLVALKIILIALKNQMKKLQSPKA